MKKNKSNTWLTEKGLEQIDFYVSSADVIVVERNRTIKILLDIFRYHFKEKKNLTLLDVGCGDGILTKNIEEKFQENVGADNDLIVLFAPDEVADELLRLWSSTRRRNF